MLRKVIGAADPYLCSTWSIQALKMTSPNINGLSWNTMDNSWPNPLHKGAVPGKGMDHQRRMAAGQPGRCQGSHSPCTRSGHRTTYDGASLSLEKANGHTPDPEKEMMGARDKERDNKHSANVAPPSTQEADAQHLHFRKEPWAPPERTLAHCGRNFLCL